MGNNSNIEGRSAVLGANALVGCLKGGIGAATRDEGFWQGCGKGALGGAIAFAGEEVASHNMYPFVGSAGKLIHDLGISMSDNVMVGNALFSQFRTDFGPVNMLFRHGSYLPKFTFTLTPAYGIINALWMGAQFDIKNSVYNLTPIFTVTNLSKWPAPSYINSSQFTMSAGKTSGNVVRYPDPKNLPKSIKASNNLVLSHEVNHTLFWRKLNFTNELVPFHDNEYLKWWDFGQDLSRLVSVSGRLVDGNSHNSPAELEAYAMQRCNLAICEK